MGKRRYFYFVIGIVLLAAFSITGISLLISSPALYVENIKISKEEAEFSGVGWNHISDNI